MKLDKFHNYFWIIITICCFILIGISLVAEGSQQHITLAWDANNDRAIGYDVWVSYEKGGPYTQIGTNDGINNIEFTWYGILSGDEYYFVVSAFDIDGMESAFSNEVCAFIDADEDYAIECGTEYSSDESGRGSKGCFISVITPCS